MVEVAVPEGSLTLMTREQAWQIVCEHTKSDSLRRHMLGVEACMRWYARQLGANEETWGNAGLLHDFDYESHPEEHPKWGIAYLEERGVEPEILGAIAAHYPEFTGVEPTTPIERYLYACDELSGFITAVTYVRPSRNIADVEVKSVLKKLKTPAFAAGVDRDIVGRGFTLINLPPEEHIANLLAAMKAEAAALGLGGNPPGDTPTLDPSVE